LATSGYFAANAINIAGFNGDKADKRNSHETARGMRFELEQRANLFSIES